MGWVWLISPFNGLPHCIPDDASVVAYIYPRASHRDKRTVVGIVNRKLELGVAIHYNTRQFPRCANWQHWGKHEYVAALEPSNGSVEGRNLDRENRVLDSLTPGARKSYRYRIEVATGKKEIQQLLHLNDNRRPSH